jgi:ectoine hydroxylase-related dioxygenase (phytanoyl-CoA dioxygenase family)
MMDVAHRTARSVALNFLNPETERIVTIGDDVHRFDALIRALFGSDDLQKLHLQYPEHSNGALADRHTNIRTWFHNKYYERLRTGWPEFREAYGQLAARLAREHLSEGEIIYQHDPTLRVAVPGNTTGPFHTDAEYNHPVRSLNFILAITPMFESNTVVCESRPGARDLRHMTLTPGEVFQFNGMECLHGSLINTTGVTRVSLDFRLLRVRDYDPDTTECTLTSKVRFRVGEYYDRSTTSG